MALSVSHSVLTQDTNISSYVYDMERATCSLAASSSNLASSSSLAFRSNLASSSNLTPSSNLQDLSSPPWHRLGYRLGMSRASFDIHGIKEGEGEFDFLLK